MLCEKCGKNSDDSAVFCEVCGNKLTPAVYSVKGAGGKHLYVYPDKCVISTKSVVESFLTGNYTDGEKTIYYTDCIGIQFRRAESFLGYIQIETSSSLMNRISSNFFNENSFSYDGKAVSNDYMQEVYLYMKRKVEELKGNKGTTASPADEIKKYKELLDSGAITQEEFEEMKKKLLNL